MNIPISSGLIQTLGWIKSEVQTLPDGGVLFNLSNYALEFYNLTNRVKVTYVPTSTVVRDEFCNEETFIYRIYKIMLDLDIYTSDPANPVGVIPKL